MRRFIGYLVLVLSIMALALFDLQYQIQSMDTGMEYDGGYEIVYRVDDDGVANKIDSIAKQINDKLEASGVKNFTVSGETTAEDDDDSYQQVRISMEAENTTELENALKYIEATGNITISTLDNSGKECFFDRGTAKVDFANGTPYVEVSVDSKDDWETLVTDSETAYKTYMEKQGQDTSESEITGIMIVWINKTEQDSYERAVEDTPEGLAMQEKILSVVPTNYYSKDDGTLKIASWGIGSNAKGFTAESAHAIERIINGEEASYSLTRLYVNKVSATAGVNFKLITLIAAITITVGCAVYLCVKFGLIGLTGIASITFTDVMCLLVFNFLGYSFTTMSFLGLILGTVFEMVLIINYLEKFKNELYMGRNAVKACNNAMKQTFVTNIDLSVVTLLVCIVSTYVATHEIRLMPSFVIISAIVGFIVTSLLFRFANSWLAASSKGEAKKIFNIKESMIPDVNKMESQKKFNRFHSLDVNKYSKGCFITSLIVSAIAVIGVVTLSVCAIFTPVTTYNYSDEFASYGRIELITEVEDILDDEEKVKTILDQCGISYNDITIGYDTDVVIEGREDTVDEIDYVSITVDSLPSDANAKAQLKTTLTALDDEIQIHYDEVSPVNPTYKVLNVYICVGVISALAVAYVLVRFRYTFSLAELVTLLPVATVFIGLACLTRIPVNTVALTGVIAALIATVMSQVPLFNAISRIKSDSKVKIVTKEQRKEVITEAAHDSLFIVNNINIMTSIVFGVLTIGAVATFSSYMIVCLFGAFITSLIGLIANRFILVPALLYCDNKFSLKKAPKNTEKAKAKLKAQAKKRRTSLAEPEEATIPGIND